MGHQITEIIENYNYTGYLLRPLWQPWWRSVLQLMAQPRILCRRARVPWFRCDLRFSRTSPQSVSVPTDYFKCYRCICVCASCPIHQTCLNLWELNVELWAGHTRAYSGITTFSPTINMWPGMDWKVCLHPLAITVCSSSHPLATSGGYAPACRTSIRIPQAVIRLGAIAPS